MKKYIHILLMLVLLLGGCASKPTEQPATTTAPTTAPTSAPISALTQATQPTTVPTTAPTSEPTTAPTTEPTTAPTTAPTTEPTTPPTVEPTAPVRDAKHLILRYQAGKNHTDYNDGYEGEEFTTDGMKDGGLYAVNDGEVFIITEQYVSDWERCIVRGPVTYTSHVFYVLRDEPTKVWISDKDGKEQSLLYDSSYGEITFLYHHSDTPQMLYIAESKNRIVAYDMQAKSTEVLFEAHMIEQFSYQPSEQKIYWKGYFYESDPVNPYVGNTYHYYTDKKECWMYVSQNKEWILVPPE